MNVGIDADTFLSAFTMVNGDTRTNAGTWPTAPNTSGSAYPSGNQDMTSFSLEHSSSLERSSKSLREEYHREWLEQVENGCRFAPTQVDRDIGKELGFGDEVRGRQYRAAAKSKGVTPSLLVLTIIFIQDNTRQETCF
jgi:hypothetical protein